MSCWSLSLTRNNLINIISRKKRCDISLCVQEVSEKQTQRNELPFQVEETIQEGPVFHSVIRC